ncbi:MAG: MopE-related protein, partial [Myxococcota bacterium]|nr:MopE-related protein [Myxococcota bacterium]
GDPDVNPGAEDEPYDGVDSDCDERGDYDADGDGHASSDYGGDDCDDANSSINPSAEETWYDGLDQDCDGNDDDQDGDGISVEDDCDDTDPEIGTGCGDDTGDVDTAQATLDTGGLAPDKLEGGFSGGGCAGCASGGAAPVGIAGLFAFVSTLMRRRRN